MVTVEQAKEMGVVFRVSVEEESLASPEEHAEKGWLPSECVPAIRERLDSCDPWAWADVCISAEWRGFKGTSDLGCCSYEDEADFRRGGYLPQKEEEALEDLKSVLTVAVDGGRRAEMALASLG